MFLTRLVLRRKKKAKAVLAAIKVHGTGVVSKLEEIFAPLRQEGQAIPNYAGDLADLENTLILAYDKIEAADDVHLKDVATDQRLRRLRDDAAGRLQQVLLKLSQTIDSSYGPKIAEETLGLGTGLRAVPDQIYDIGRRVRDTLAEPEFTFPRPSLQGADLVAEELHSGIVTPLDELGGLLDSRRHAQRQFDETLRQKLEAISEFDRNFAAVATWLKGMFLAAGETMLAKRIRPTIPAPAKPGDDDKVVEVDDETGEEKEVESAAPSQSPQTAESSASPSAASASS